MSGEYGRGGEFLEHVTPRTPSLRREALYKYARPYLYENQDELYEEWGITEIENRLIEELKLRGDEEIVDVGCGDGAFLRRLYKAQGHRGLLTGVDIDPGPYQDFRNELGNNVTPVELIQWDAKNLPFKNWSPDDDKSGVDIFIANFLLHYVGRNAGTVINKAKDMLRPGGKLVVATRGPLNFFHMYHNAKEVAAPALRAMLTIDEEGKSVVKYPSLIAPKQFYTAFDLEKAVHTIPPLGFQSLSLFRHGWPEYNLKVPLSGWGDYCDAFAALASKFKPEVSEEDMVAAIKQQMEPIFKHRVESDGHFTELIDEGYQIFEKVAA